jgi:hypothetical protein
MAFTYEPISTTTLGSAQGSVTFSSISGSYTDLVLVVSGYVATSDGAVPVLQFNGDTATNYSGTFLSANGTTARSDRNTTIASSWISYSPGFSTTSANVSVVTAHIQNYSNTTTFKSVLGRMNSSLGNYAGVGASIGMWRSTAAITSVLVGLSAGTYATGTTFTLYGIKAA